MLLTSSQWFQSTNTICQWEPKLFGYQHSSKYLLYSVKKKSNRVGLTWRWINPFFRVECPFKGIHWYFRHQYVPFSGRWGTSCPLRQAVATLKVQFCTFVGYKTNSGPALVSYMNSEIRCLPDWFHLILVYIVKDLTAVLWLVNYSLCLFSTEVR